MSGQSPQAPLRARGVPAVASSGQVCPRTAAAADPFDQAPPRQLFILVPDATAAQLLPPPARSQLSLTSILPLSLPSSHSPSCYPACALALLCIGASEPLLPHGDPASLGERRKENNPQTCAHTRTHTLTRTPPRPPAAENQPNYLFLSLSLSLLPASSHKGRNLKFQHPVPPLSPPPQHVPALVPCEHLAHKGNNPDRAKGGAEGRGRGGGSQSNLFQETERPCEAREVHASPWSWLPWGARDRVP